MIAWERLLAGCCFFHVCQFLEISGVLTNILFYFLQFYKYKLWKLLLDAIFELNLLALLFTVTLKNAAELLEFAAMYNAEQLKLSCLQFIVLNMAALLESK